MKVLITWSRVRGKKVRNRRLERLSFQMVTLSPKKPITASFGTNIILNVFSLLSCKGFPEPCCSQLPLADSSSILICYHHSFPPLAEPLSWATYSNCLPTQGCLSEENISRGVNNLFFLIELFMFLCYRLFPPKNLQMQKHLFLWVQGLLDRKSVSYYIKE